MLKDELIGFRRVKGYFPHVILIHLFPKFEEEIKEEVNEVAKELKISIDIACEGKEVIV